MASGHAFEVLGYRLEADRCYDPATHLWAQPVTPGRVRIGFDPLGRETAGDIVAISLVPCGTRVRRGGELGSIEAAKFVGPLDSPLTGTVAAHNADVLADPNLINEDPGAHWLAELDLDDPGELDRLLAGEGPVSEWFAAEVERFRAQGAVAE